METHKLSKTSQQQKKFAQCRGASGAPQTLLCFQLQFHTLHVLLNGLCALVVPLALTFSSLHSSLNALASWLASSCSHLHELMMEKANAFLHLNHFVALTLHFVSQLL